MADLLRGTAAFSQFSAALRVSMVEVSPYLRGMQWRALRCPGPPPEAEAQEGAPAAHQQQQGDARTNSSSNDSTNCSEEAAAAAWSGVSGWNGARVRWHRSLDEVASVEGEPALFIAHEFLDALPVHQFQKTGAGGPRGAPGARGRRGGGILVGRL
jgi:NADH dehydrogenase [ubiquinone] 1 alpha subcomplex assembly factor 7